MRKRRLFEHNKIRKENEQIVMRILSKKSEIDVESLSSDWQKLSRIRNNILRIKKREKSVQLP